MIPNIELQSPEKIKAFQEEQLKVALHYLLDRSPFYQRMFSLNTIQISEIQSLEDLTKIPTTTKDDLQKYNDDFLCVPKKQIIDYVTTSGTLGGPVVFALTDADLERLAYNEAISFACTGITADDTLQLMATMDRRFMAGLAYFLGARKLGAGIIRVGAEIPELQWDSIQKFSPTYLVGVPSFILKLIDYAQEHQIQLHKSSVKAVICIGEPIRNDDFSYNTLGQQITDLWDIQLFSTYASTEMSTAFTECSAMQGGHLHPELIIVEILDEAQNPVSEGELGELTITTLGVEAMPLLRFRTGDMVKAIHEPCACARNTLRLSPVMGRRQQMIKYKGTTMYPQAIINILQRFENLETYVVEISTNALGTDDLHLMLASADASDMLLDTIQKQLQSSLRVIPTISWHSLEELQKLQISKTGRKPTFVIDKRSK